MARTAATYALGSHLSCTGRVRQWLGAVQGGHGVGRVSMPPARYDSLAGVHRGRCVSAPPSMTHAALDGILAKLTDAGLLEMFTDEDDRPAMRLTEQGVQVARQMAMSGDVDAEAVLAALLDELKLD